MGCESVWFASVKKARKAAACAPQASTTADSPVDGNAPPARIACGLPIPINDVVASTFQPPGRNGGVCKLPLAASAICTSTPASAALYWIAAMRAPAHVGRRLAAWPLNSELHPSDATARSTRTTAARYRRIRAGRSAGCIGRRLVLEELVLAAIAAGAGTTGTSATTARALGCIGNHVVLQGFQVRLRVLDRNVRAGATGAAVAAITARRSGAAGAARRGHAR